MFYVRVPGARVLGGFLHLVVTLGDAAFESDPGAAGCARSCAVGAARAFGVFELVGVSGCCCATEPLRTNAGGAAGAGGEVGGDGGGVPSVRARVGAGLLLCGELGDRERRAAVGGLCWSDVK